ncbi:AaceriADR279Cp [[Ashbya] aceris (nom. inval.)]|nr:AaceriADR279Cp [[Ashbya] aceris (nom. inval.)]
MSKKKAVKAVGDSAVSEVDIRNGPQRPFLVTEPNPALCKTRLSSTWSEKTVVGALMGFAAAVRLYNLKYPDSVVFDEVHFGGYASKYIQGAFFLDVHPPLAKMLFAGISKVAGFAGDFGFEDIGIAYPETVPYQVMRFLPAAMGVLTVLLMFLTLRASGVRRYVAFAMCVAFTVENSFVTISRYILLDSPLLFFIAAAVYSFKRLELYPTGTLQYYKCLAATGMALGLAMSSKWVGFFTFAWVGVVSVLQLWLQVGDLTKPVPSIFKQSAVKASVLFALPVCLYVLFFRIHFQSLPNVTDAAGFFSSAFRTTLHGHTIPANIYAAVGIGSTVTMRHIGTMGGYLHSHNHMYQGGSEQQQVTLYPHLDQNNHWYIEYYNASNTVPTTFEGLADGTKIRLKHVLTGHRLHSHDHKPPVSVSSDWQKEVSGYGFPDFEGDANDDWVVEIDKDKSAPGEARERVRALETKFRLRHAMTGCLLFSHQVKLPKWGFEQQEVTCATQGKPELTLWYIEENTNPLLPESAEKISYKIPNFWEKLVEMHKKMWHINKSLTDPHMYQSDPIQWPFLLRGISYWSKDSRQVYLLGNAVVWYSVTLFIAIFGLACVGELFVWQLGKPVLTDAKVINFHIQTVHYLLGYFIHYLPSFMMGRQMFLHHYLPAYYFGILALAQGFDGLVTVLNRKRPIAYGLLVMFVLGSIAFFVTYSPLVYGLQWTRGQCAKTQLLADWDYTCTVFPETYDVYSSTPFAEFKEANTPAITDAPVEAKGPDAGLDIESIIANPDPKKFVDQHGNELSPEQVKNIVQEKGGYIKGVSGGDNLL